MKLTAYDQPHRSRKQWYELAAKNGISKALFYNRLQQGWTKQDAATKPKGKYVLKNRPPKSEITKLAEKSGLSYSTIHSRLNRGWSVEAATTTPLKRKGNNKEAEHG
ncbi:hypothetical protein [Vreelandella venusta]|uniref:hypothetical protein n=1 Tax=Vreelandella venusta TaxID=44935 RepID=UPI003AA88115